MATFKVIGKGEDGKYFDDLALKDVINYVLNPQKTKSHLVGAYGVQIEFAAQQMEFVSRAYNNYDKLRLRHFIISFADSDCILPCDAIYIAQRAAEFYANRYQIIFGIHEDADHLHVHFVMNQVSYLDGRKYSGSKKEHYDFVNYMKDICYGFGIDFIPVSEQSDR